MYFFVLYFTSLSISTLYNLGIGNVVIVIQALSNAWPRPLRYAGRMVGWYINESERMRKIVVVA